MRAFAGPFFLAAIAFGAVSTGAAAAERPAVIELFTSQGCSSCPPADALLADLAREHPGYITLSLPVDYWDYIGWKDTLATPAFTARQKAYALARGDHHVYTPQAVVNGLVHAVGSDRNEIVAAAESSFGEHGAMAVSLQTSAEPDGLAVDVGAAPEGAPREGVVWVFQITHEQTVAIGRGENSGRTVAYTNVVRAMHKVGAWNGVANHYDIPRRDLASSLSDSYVLMLQAVADDKPGAILAAARGT